MKMIKLICLFACLISLVGCLDNSTGDTTTSELVTRENYFIANQSDLDLTVIYQITSTDIDSSISVPADSTTKIFENGGVGDSSTPSSSFARLRFHQKSGDMNSPLLTIEPVVNERWNFTPGNDDESAKYQLVINKEDLQ